MIVWGRSKKAGGPADAPVYRRFFILAAAVAACLAIFSFRGVPAKGGDVSVLRSEEIAAANAIRDTGAVPALLTVDGGGKEDEPPGFINGRWNFWEYIGDRLASALFGK